MNESRTPLVVLISGSGSNLQAIIDATSQPDYPAYIAAVISNVANVKGLARAERAGIPTTVLDHTAYTSRETYDAELRKQIDSFKPEIVILAGFMRILTDDFVNAYAGRMLNIHPSLLPKYKGLHTHEKAIDAGEQYHGATVHFVTPDLDSGPFIIQAQVPVKPEDDAAKLAARVLEKEHIIYPRAIDWVSTGRVKMKNGAVVMDGKPLHRPVMLD